MLLTKEIEVELRGILFKHFEELGYVIPKILDKYGRLSTPNKTKIIVKVEDLSRGSKQKVEVLCDFCNVNISNKAYSAYMNAKEKSITNKDCCNNPFCVNTKREETMLFRYGNKHSMKIDIFKQKAVETNILKYNVSNPQQNEQIRNKTKQTRVKRYGVEHILQSKEYKDKAINTTQKRYGVDYYTQTDEYKIRSVNTFQEKYGVNNIFQSEEFKKKSKLTSIKKYGVDHPMKNLDIKAKGLKTMFRNGTQKTSKQQLFLHNIIGGELNYLVSRMFLDIAFSEEMIYLEYDGGFHNGKVICGMMTQEEFDKQERKRSCQLSDWGWREIRIISKDDKLPSNNKIIEMLNYARNYLNNGHHWIKFDIDNNKIINSLGEFDYNFEELRYIKDRDLEDIS